MALDIERVHNASHARPAVQALAGLRTGGSRAAGLPRAILHLAGCASLTGVNARARRAVGAGKARLTPVKTGPRAWARNHMVEARGVAVGPDRAGRGPTRSRAAWALHEAASHVPSSRRSSWRSWPSMTGEGPASPTRSFAGTRGPQQRVNSAHSAEPSRDFLGPRRINFGDARIKESRTLETDPREETQGHARGNMGDVEGGSIVAEVR